MVSVTVRDQEMATAPFFERFFASTRGQIVTLLRTDDRTVDELASELELTDNAVRSQLAALERDGLVEQSGVQRGVSKPAHLYRLTRDAGQLFGHADGPMLRHLLDAMVDRLSPVDVAEVLDDTGQRVASAFPSPRGSLEERVEQSVALLGDMGGLAESEASENGYFIRGFSCPLAAAGTGHSAVCQLAASFISAYIDAPVRPCCVASDPSAPPRCCFEVLRSDRPANDYPE